MVERIDDAEALWRLGRTEGALLMALLAVEATAKRKFPGERSSRRRFEQVMRDAREWRIDVEYRGRLVSVEELLYRWVRSELVHAGELPIDLIVHDGFDPNEIAVRAGGSPGFTVHLGAGWFHHLIDVVKADPVNACLFEAVAPTSREQTGR